MSQRPWSRASLNFGRPMSKQQSAIHDRSYGPCGWPEAQLKTHLAYFLDLLEPAMRRYRNKCTSPITIHPTRKYRDRHDTTFSDG